MSIENYLEVKHEIKAQQDIHARRKATLKRISNERAGRTQKPVQSPEIEQLEPIVEPSREPDNEGLAAREDDRESGGAAQRIKGAFKIKQKD